MQFHVSLHGSLTRYKKLQVAHASGMPGTFSPPPWVSNSDMHHGTCVAHVPWCMPGSLTSGFRQSWWRGKRSRHSRRMRKPQFYVSGKRPMALKSRSRNTFKLLLMWKTNRYSHNVLCQTIKSQTIWYHLRQLYRIFCCCQKYKHKNSKHTGWDVDHLE